MMRVFLIILSCCWSLFVNAQTDSGKTILPSTKMYGDQVSYFTADNLGNIYVLASAGLLKKYNSNGDSLNVYNNVRRYGALYTIDATNPMKLLLYHKSFSTVVMLDRYMNSINTIDLRKAGIFQAKALGLAYDNNIWVFDEQSSKLKKISEEGGLLTETTDLRQVLDRVPSPEKIIDRDGFVYLYDQAQGVYIFDYYGVLKNELHFTGISDMQVINKTIVGRRQGNFVRYTPGTLDLQEHILPPAIQHAQKICIMPQGIYVLENENITLYPFH